MKHKYSTLLLAAGLLTAQGTMTARAQDTAEPATEQTDLKEYDGPININFGARVDYQRDYRQGETFDDECGFKGKYFMLNINGNITNRFSYVFRQRINNIKSNNSFFDGTDYLYLKYRFNRKWDVQGGKMALAIGSMEYERHPMEIYLTSEFFNMIPCYKFGVSLGFNVTENDRLVAQFTESPFRKKGTDLYGYTFAWYGNHDWFHTVYSANVLEYQPGKFIYYLGLGHRLAFDKVYVEFDYLNRATNNHAFFFKDCSVIGEVGVQPTKHWNVFAKASYNRNVTDDPADECVWAGTDMTQVGGGLEYFPLRNGDKSLRVHAAYSYHFGKNGNPNGALQKDQHFMTVGLQWQMDLVDLARKAWNKAKRKNG